MKQAKKGNKGKGQLRTKPRDAPPLVSIPADVALSPQSEPPRGPYGLDRSSQSGKGRVKELSWAEFDRLVQGMAQRIRKAWGKRQQEFVVVGVAHGGVFVGGAVASALRSEFFPVRISRRSRDHVVETTPRLSGEMPAELKGRRVLIVDDVAASGDTLLLATELAKKAGAKDVETAALIQRPDGFEPDYAAQVTGDFLVFPWDYDMVQDERFRL